MKTAFCITYGGSARNGSTYVPYKAIAHTADEAIAVINTWKSYGRKNSTSSADNIVVNERTAEKIRSLFSMGIKPEHEGKAFLCSTMRTTGCGAWDISFYPALGDTLEEHVRIYNEQREAAKQERMRQAEAAKQRRLGELYQQRKGWYHVELGVKLMVFAHRGNDYFADLTFEGNIIADSGADAYNKAEKYVQEHPEELTHRGNIGALHDWADMTSHDFTFTFLGVKTDDGYSIDKWNELYANK